jgi:hypothetical protein
LLRRRDDLTTKLWMPHQVRHDDKEIISTLQGRWAGRVHPGINDVEIIVVAGCCGPPHGKGTRDALLRKNCILTVYSMYIKRM